MRIQHNIMSMNAYRNYNTNTSALSKNLEKLSSGYKINRAGDDAAGLAISEKMRAQITGLNAAQKNVKDGISLVKTAEGAMQEIQDMLNRMDYLATQSANGTYDNEVDRANLQKEVDQLKSEINRIADSSNFNGIKLLDGSLDTTLKTTGDTDLKASLEIISDGQLGNKATAGVFELDLTNFEGTSAAGAEVKISVFGQELTVVKKPTVGQKITGEDIAKAFENGWTTKIADTFKADYGVSLKAEVNGSKVTFTMSAPPTKAWDVDSAVSITGLDNDAVDGTQPGNQAHGVEVRTLTEPVDSSAGRRYAQAKLDLSTLMGKVKDGSTLTIGDTTYTFAVGKGSSFKGGSNVIDLTDMTEDDLKAQEQSTLGKVASRITTAAQGNKNFKVTSTSAVGDAKPDGYIYFTELEGGVDTDDYKLEGTNNKDNSSTDGDWTGFIKLGTVDTASMGKALTLQIGDTSDSYNQLKVNVGDMHTASLGIADLDISSPEAASNAIQTIRDAINKVSSVRGDLGATQNRLEHTANNLSVMAENIQDAESTIRDTDVAEEMMAYTKNNILVQSAQAMLAQANAVPQGVLQLLG
jgi:flagellin